MEAEPRPDSAEDLLLDRARAGDPDALGEIFDQYHNQVYSLSYRILGSAVEAEDLTQEVFLQVFRKIGSFQGRSSFSTWLYRVTVNKARDQLRGRRRSLELLTDDGEEAGPGRDRQPPSGHPGPEGSAMAEEARRLVRGALAELPFSLRAPLVLHELQGLEYREVARVLRVPVGTVKSRIFRGRLKLAQLLEPHKEQWR